MKTTLLQILFVLALLFTGCETEVSNIDMRNDDGKQVMALDYRDFDQAASKLVQSLISSGALKKADNSRYVVATGRIINDTMQRIDTSQLMSKIEIEMLRSGQAVMTSAVGANTDAMVYETRELRNSEEFNPDTVVKKRTLIAPELSVSGKILQRNIKYGKNLQQVEYYFQLKLSDIKAGLVLWQDEEIIGKRGDKKSVSW
ncbi:MAG: penicillin-binding protein activator LpoB [Planctomycetota bacterium]|jgi:uncharacterized protein (TIGR02722 family)